MEENSAKGYQSNDIYPNTKNDCGANFWIWGEDFRQKALYLCLLLQHPPRALLELRNRVR